LSLGTNLGDRQANLTRALDRFDEEQVRVLRRSSIYETEPRDVLNQPSFLNMVVECETAYFPIQLLGVLLRIEREMGRRRGAGTRRGGPRLIDIDILLYEQIVMDTPQLTIPHPRMTTRRFVLEPLLELAPGLRYPQTKENLSQHLQKVRDQKVRRL
jgi:2-amino-4-hydroxy-6-hydroxymethyldihydropteridine diphosphokinase